MCKLIIYLVAVEITNKIGLSLHKLLQNIANIKFFKQTVWMAHNTALYRRLTFY
jgi:hypothetical protein